MKHSTSLLSVIIFIMIFSSCGNTSEQIDPQLEKLQQENNNLRALLAEKMQNNCDTATTINERISLQQFKEFQRVAILAKDSAELALHIEKQQLEDAEYSATKDAISANFIEWEKVRLAAYAELERTHPVEFTRMLVLDFWELHGNYGNPDKNHDEYLCRQKIDSLKKIDGPIKLCFTTIYPADSVKKFKDDLARFAQTEKKKVIDATYELKKQRIEALYQASLMRKRQALGIPTSELE